MLIIDSLGDLGLEALLTSFADDSKLAYKIETIEDALYMQECLDKLQSWQIENNMDFNVKKFNVLKLGRNSDIKLNYNYIAPGLTQVITDNETVRDIGIIINSKANFNDHISKIYSKITQRAGLLLRQLKIDLSLI